MKSVNQNIRIKRAWTAVIVICMAVASTGFISQSYEKAATESTAEPRSTYTHQIWESLKEDASFEGALHDSGIYTASAKDAPSWFLSEVAPSDLPSQILFTEDWSIVCMFYEAPASTIFENITNELYYKGWQSDEEESELCATFAKQKGRSRWLMTNYTEVDGGTSVVLHIQHT